MLGACCLQAPALPALGTPCPALCSFSAPEQSMCMHGQLVYSHTLLTMCLPCMIAEVRKAVPGSPVPDCKRVGAHAQLHPMQARVRGAVRGALTPLSVPALAKSLALQGGGIAGRSLGAVLEVLM